MDKAFAQALLLFAMLGVAALTPTIYLEYSTPNTPQSQTELKLYAETAASLFYADLYELAETSYDASYFLHIQPISGWMCADFFNFSWRSGSLCSDMVVQNETVSRNFTATFYKYYTVMVYVPPEMPTLNLTFDWWFKVNGPPTGWFWFGAYIFKGNVLASNASFDVIETAPFYWSNNFVDGAMNGTYSGLKVPAGNTLAVLVNVFPGLFPKISYGFTVRLDGQKALTVLLPSKYYAVSLTQQGKTYGVEAGPTATFNIAGPIQALLEVYYNNTLVAEENTTFTPGETVVFYPNPSYQQAPRIVLLLNYPVQVSVTGSSLTVSYGREKATITLDATLLGGGTSSAWTITLVGCQKKCVLAVVPAQTKQ